MCPLTLPPLGVVLAGGRSSRMGEDKTLLRLDGESLVARAAAKLSQVVPEVVLADRERRLDPRWVSLPDGPGRGPVAGLLGAAAGFPNRPLLALACDLPNISTRLLALLATDDCHDWVMPRSTNGVEPLCALYRPGALAVLAQRVVASRYSLYELETERSLSGRVIESAELRLVGDPELLFANLNTPEDWTRLGHSLAGVDAAQIVETVDPGAVAIRKQQ